ncbi:hypothetical protein [Absidia glauca]|uniref:Integrase catalytic domain-containing protein n=1 Tax=Absidia glauca TaxID=4829 RepID=A0A168R4S9_ABSGL|nr:hypothetical protein [Absidia glauca]
MEQQKDPKLQDIIKDISAHSQFLVANDTLYKVHRRKRAITKNHLYIVVPAHLVNDMITHYYASKFAGHCGIRKTIAKISSHRLWWSNMQLDVTRHCLACQTCQRIKGKRSHSYHQGSTTGEIPFQRVALDYWGPLPTSTRGNKYVFVVLDTYTRFVELYATKLTNHQDLASTFYNRFILRHGVPTEILSDNGVPFNSLFSTQVIKLIGSENLFAPAYHPASNGAVERFMKTLRNMILTYTNNDIISDNWDQHLSIIQFVYNTTVNDTTQHTPFYLTHGRNPRTPLIVTQEGHFVDHYKSPSQQYATDLQDRLNLAFDLMDQLKANTNQLNQVNPYKIGDLVLVFNHAHTTKNKPRKLAFDWYGPLMVTSLISKSSCNLKYQESSKVLKNVHVSRLKSIIQSLVALDTLHL